jgi:AcrR family transcriptional regulator
MKTEASQEEKIVEAAIQCIEMSGLQSVTTRKIAQIAGVNSAAINYYFRSKNALLDRALAQTTENTFGDWERIIVDPAMKPVDRLRVILTEAMEGAFQYPNLVRAHLSGPIVEGNHDTGFALRFRAFMATARDALAPELPGLAGAELERRLAALFAATFGIGLLRGLFDRLGGAMLEQSEGRAGYLELLLGDFTGGKR